jgi:hypothetical protein
MAKKKPRRSPIDAFLALSDAEKAATVAEFDREFVGDTFKPLTPKMKRQWAKIQKKLGRPRVGKGAKRVLITVERGLLSESDALAKRRRMTRSQLISEGLRHLLAAG